MNINLSYVFLWVFVAVSAIFALLCFLNRKIKGFAFLGDALRFLCLQALISLGFLLSYVFFIKNGVKPSLSDTGVAFIPITVLIYWAAWRFDVISPLKSRLLLPLAYSVFLLWRYFSVGEGLSFFGYIVFNPAFGFIGSQLVGSSFKPLGALSAVIPLLLAVIGRSFGIKIIDKQGKM